MSPFVILYTTLKCIYLLYFWFFMVVDKFSRNSGLLLCRSLLYLFYLNWTYVHIFAMMMKMMITNDFFHIYTTGTIIINIFVIFNTIISYKKKLVHGGNCLNKKEIKKLQWNIKNVLGGLSIGIWCKNYIKKYLKKSVFV